MAIIEANNHRGIAAIVVGGIISSLAVITVALRIWARALNNAQLDASDWSCVLGLVFALALFGSTIYSVAGGLGLSLEHRSFESYVQINKGMIINLITWDISTTLIRISMVLLYIRLFPTRKFVIICWAFIVETTLCALAAFIGIFFVCRPFAYTWNGQIPGGYCGDIAEFYIWSGTHNILNDIITIVLPMPLLWNLQLPRRKKLSLTLIFTMGSSICALTLVRTIEVARADAFSNGTVAYSVGLLSLLESLLGTISCCLPLLRPVAQKISTVLGCSTRRSGSANSRPSFLQSIGSRRTRAKIDDSYQLDTVATTNGDHCEEGNIGAVADGESVEQLVKGDRSAGNIMVKSEWDVTYEAAP